MWELRVAEWHEHHPNSRLVQCGVRAAVEGLLGSIVSGVAVSEQTLG